MRTTLGGAVAHYEANEPRGEYVLVIEGGTLSAKKEEINMTPAEAVAYYENSGMSRNEAVKSAAKLLGMSRNEVYRLTM